MERSGGVAAIVCNTIANTVRQGRATGVSRQGWYRVTELSAITMFSALHPAHETKTMRLLANELRTPGLLQESLSVPGVSLRVSLGPFGPCTPESVKKGVPDTPGTLGTLFGQSGVWSPQAPKETPGTLRARRAPETPVAGWGGSQETKHPRIVSDEKVSRVFIALLLCKQRMDVLANHRAALKGTGRRSRTPICGFLRSSVRIFHGFLRPQNA